MANSINMNWPVPDKDVDPWFAIFQSMVSSMDYSSFAANQDRQEIVGPCTEFSFDADSGLVEWSQPQSFISSATGNLASVSPGSAELKSGEALYAKLPRSPTKDAYVDSVIVLSKAREDDSSIALCVRVGDSVYFRNGIVLESGFSRMLTSAPESPTGSSVPVRINIGSRQSNDSDVPLTVGAVSLTPNDYSISGREVAVSFRASAANGDSGLTSYVELFNLTDGKVVGLLRFTSTSISSKSVELVLGEDDGEVGAAEKIYEARIYLGSPGVPPDSVELYSADIEIVNRPPAC